MDPRRNGEKTGDVTRESSGSKGSSTPNFEYALPIEMKCLGKVNAQSRGAAGHQSKYK